MRSVLSDRSLKLVYKTWYCRWITLGTWMWRVNLGRNRACFEVKQSEWWSEVNTLLANMAVPRVRQGQNIIFLYEIYYNRMSPWVAPHIVKMDGTCSVSAWFKTTAAAKLRSPLFLNFTQRRMVVSHRRFDTNYRYHLQGSKSLRRLFDPWRWDW